MHADKIILFLAFCAQAHALLETCYNSLDLGSSYRGGVATTKQGLKCQKWNSQTPHEHTRTPENYPDSGLELNLCRNPDGAKAPWCYTTDPTVRWQFCPVDLCPECGNVTDCGKSYRGTVSRTTTGKTCQTWNSQSPHQHDRTPEKYPNDDLRENFCRNPDGSKAPWCYTTDPNTRWEYCLVEVCEGCYNSDDLGASYRGGVAQTVTNKQCQRWDSQSPQQHTRTPENYPEAGLVDNYCRNPDGSGAPWCYTTDPNTRWEYCAVKNCKECYEIPDSGASYRGTVMHTETGKMCQSWNAQTPHQHTRTPEKYPNSGLISNFCRNPDGSEAPWCYTMDPNSRWEFCQVDVCEGCYETKDSGASYRGGVKKTVSEYSCQKWMSQTPHQHDRTPENYPESGLEDNFCRNPDKSRQPWCYTTNPQKRWDYCPVPKCPKCFDVADSGASYRGTAIRTKSGKICQPWASQTPHKHNRTPENYPDSDLVSNYCRNPDGSEAPWCYTTVSSTRWEYCEVPACKGCCESGDNGASYRGGVANTVKGLKCQRWDSQTPQQHTRTPENYPDSGLISNYCRNPDGSKAPWCYTTNPLLRWDYCSVSLC